MPTFRVLKDKTHPFLLMNKTGLNDKRLSLKAKGLLSYLLSKPDNWYFNMQGILSESKEGIVSIRSGIKELISTGYIVATQNHRNNGDFEHFDYSIYEVPQNAKYIKNKPPAHRGFAQPLKAKASNSTLLSNDNKINNDNTTTTSFSNTSNSDVDVVSLIKSDKTRELINLFTKLGIKNYKKILSSFTIPIILQYSKWISENNFTIKKPEAFLYSAIKGQWMDNIDPKFQHIKSNLFWYKCEKCSQIFGINIELKENFYCNNCQINSNL